MLTNCICSDSSKSDCKKREGGIEGREEGEGGKEGGRRKERSRKKQGGRKEGRILTTRV